MDFGYNVSDNISTVVIESSNWWFGAFVYVLGSITINFGSNLIKKDHSNIAKLETKPPIYRRYLWIIGFSIFGIGNLFNFVAFMFAAQSLLSALGSIQFVSNLFFAKIINGEKITKQSLIATCFIMAGNTLVVIFGSKTNTNNDIEELTRLFFQPPFLIYIATITILVIIFQSLFVVIDLRLKKIVEPKTPPKWMLRFQPLAYALVSAIVGTNTIIMGKAVAGLVENILEGEFSTFTSPATYVLLTIYVGMNIFWLYRLNSALRLYDAMFIIPVLQCIWLIFGVVGGGIFYQEFEKFTAFQSIFFLTGMVLLVIGILTLRPNSPQTVKKPELPSDCYAKITAKFEIEIELCDISLSPSFPTVEEKDNNTTAKCTNDNATVMKECDNSCKINNTCINNNDNNLYNNNIHNGPDNFQSPIN